MELDWAYDSTNKVLYLTISDGLMLHWKMPKDYDFGKHLPIRLQKLVEWLLLKPYYKEYPDPTIKQPEKIPDDGNVGLAFTGGKDSVAAAFCFPKEKLRLVHYHRDFNSLERYEASVEMVSYMQDKGIHSYDMLTNMDRARPFYTCTTWGLSSFFQIFIPLVLLSKYYNLSDVSCGLTLESTYMRSSAGDGTVWNDRTKEFKQVNQYFNACGLRLALPISGMTEVITTKIVNKAGYKYCSCMRNKGVEYPCGECPKCYRDALCNNKPCEQTHWIKKWLKQRPLPMVIAALHSIKNNRMKVEELEAFLKYDTSWSEKYYGASSEFLTKNCRETTGALLDSLNISTMDDIDISTMKSWKIS